MTRCQRPQAQYQPYEMRPVSYDGQSQHQHHAGQSRLVFVPNVRSFHGPNLPHVPLWAKPIANRDVIGRFAPLPCEIQVAGVLLRMSAIRAAPVQRGYRPGHNMNENLQCLDLMPVVHVLQDGPQNRSSSLLRAYMGVQRGTTPKHGRCIWPFFLPAWAAMPRQWGPHNGPLECRI